ncbi:MAG: hypothetical protein ACYC9Q_09640 [Bacillota bacterium]
MSEASRIAGHARQSLPRIKRGRPSFFGDTLDLPAGETRTIADVDLEDECLVLRFETGEILRVWDPSGPDVGDNSFVIAHASRVVWEWYPDLAKQSPEGRLYREYSVRGSGIEARTNADPYMSRLQPKVGYPAVELC